jgi:hypothetical protein
MIEIFPILFVAAIAIGAYAGARNYAASSVNRGVRTDLIRIKAQQAWLQSRVLRARRENWEVDMLSHLEDQLAATEVELANNRAQACAGVEQSQPPR